MRSFKTPMLVVGFVTLLVSVPARGDEDSASRQKRALSFAEEGKIRYDAGRFSEALDFFSKAYEVWPYPEFLFDTCQTFRHLRVYDKAIFACRSYLRNRPDAPNREEVQGLITEMSTLVAEEKQANKKPPRGVIQPETLPTSEPTSLPLTDEAPVHPWYTNGWAWGLAGVGVATVATGLLLVHMDGTCSSPPAPVPHGICPTVYDTKTGGIAATAGGALLVGGAGLWFSGVF